MKPRATVVAFILGTATLASAAPDQVPPAAPPAPPADEPAAPAAPDEPAATDEATAAAAGSSRAEDAPASPPDEPAAPAGSAQALPEERQRAMIREEIAKGLTSRVGDVTMHGYFRTGVGVSGDRGRMVCFQVPGTAAKYRLGNECDQYGEWTFSTPAYVGDDGVTATANLMLNIYAPTSNGHGGSVLAAGSGADFGIAQLWFDIRNIDFLHGGTPWIGRRYYKREDIHIQDFFYWNPTGLGGGVEDVAIGPMKLSYAAFVVDDPGTATDPVPPRTDIGVRNDVQLRGIPLHPRGELRLGANVIVDASDRDTTHSGFAANAMYVLSVLGGENKLVLQYGLGPGVALGASDALTTPTDRTRLRVLDFLSFQLTPDLGGQLVAIYQRDDLAPGTLGWISAGGRVSYAVHEHAKVLAELGFDTVRPDDGGRRNLAKLTVAPSLVTGRGFWFRPELRLFATVALFNDAARAAGVDSGGVYAATDRTAAATFGIHADGWW